MSEENPEETVKIYTWTLKVFIHCDGCKGDVKKLLQSMNGVTSVTVEKSEHKVIVTGTLDSPEELIKKLQKARKHAELWSESQADGEFQGKVGCGQGKEDGDKENICQEIVEDKDITLQDENNKMQDEDGENNKCKGDRDEEITRGEKLDEDKIQGEDDENDKGKGGINEEITRGEGSEGTEKLEKVGRKIMVLKNQIHVIVIKMVNIITVVRDAIWRIEFTNEDFKRFVVSVVILFVVLAGLANSRR